jgi:hypothetical protein
MSSLTSSVTAAVGHQLFFASVVAIAHVFLSSIGFLGRMYYRSTTHGFFLCNRGKLNLIAHPSIARERFSCVMDPFHRV